MSSKLPPASTLYAFEAAARHESFSRAAEELGVTQPAVSRAIGNLEEALGENLFVRSGPRVQLTKSGSELGAVLSDAFSAIGQLNEIWENRRNGRPAVLLSISSSMAAHWLIPRMFKFRQAFPEIDLHFDLISGGVGNSTVDASLGLRRIDVPGTEQEDSLFVKEIIQPMATLNYISRMGSIERPQSKQPHTLIALSAHWCDWTKFAQMGAFQLPEEYKLVTFSDYSVALEFALGGQGIIMGWLSVTARLLSMQRLVAASNHSVSTGATFNFIAAKDQVNNPVILRLREWMCSEMASDILQIRNLRRSHANIPNLTLPPH